MVFAAVKVPPGVKLSVDRHFEVTDEDEKDLVWLAEKRDNHINLTRPGYGTRGDYGNGSAYARIKENLEFLTPWVLLESPLLDDVREWKF